MPKMTTARYWYYPLPNPYYCPYENVTDGEVGQAASACDSGIDASKTSNSVTEGKVDNLDFESSEAQDESPSGGRANLDDSGGFEQSESSSNERFPEFSFRKNDTGSWMVCNGSREHPNAAGGTWIISSDMDLIGGPLPSLPSPTPRPHAVLDLENSFTGQRERISSSESEFEDRYSYNGDEHFGSDVSEPPETQDDFNPAMNSTLELNMSDMSMDCHELESANQEDFVSSSQAQDGMNAQENSIENVILTNDCQTTETSSVSAPAPFMLSEMVEQLSRILELAKIRRQNDVEERKDEKNYGSAAKATHAQGLQQEESYHHNPHRSGRPFTQVKYNSSRVLFPNRILDSSHPTTSNIFANRLSQCRQCNRTERMSLSLTTQTEIPVQGTHEKLVRSDL